ncbi:DNA repair ATPase [Deinococcus aquaedulcis]|uniref:DNA repair ATPase n=1 Tax=Deinococcus aquaedulcis TaxID=2840455 RepID=UPI001C83616D|nr:DNA repair ATPase [Deinococcus aquaedulcis]
MTDPALPTPDTSLDQAVAEGGAYEVLRKRLLAQGAQLRRVADDLNAGRVAEFGDSRLSLLGRFRVQTEHNGVGRSVVQVGGGLLFGFNVFLGLKTQTQVADVFGLYRLVEVGSAYDVEPVSLKGTFLADPAFTRDFDELYAYYKHARLLTLSVQGDKLLAAFQIGERSSDRRVFRWALGPAGEVTYLDARGERDLKAPAPFDFEWTRAGREQAVSGRFPHLNILDTLFVETSGGDLTIKVENNTETGQGIYSEPVEDRTQSLDDATFEFAQVGTLILLRVLPYREKVWRGLIYNTLTRQVTRNDAITRACVSLPEDHGLIFPGGYYLQNGDHRAFEAAHAGMGLGRVVRSPNGEDVLYVFSEPDSGLSALFVYNLIRREVQPPMLAHGWAPLPDGRMVLFHAESGEPTRVHPMQVWQTPFVSDLYAASRPPGTSYLGRLGNAELVRGVSNLYELAREIEHPSVSAERYARLEGATRRLFDQHRWFDDDHTSGLRTLLHGIVATTETVLDEFEKVQSLRAAAAQALQAAQADHRALLARVRPEDWTRIDEYVAALADLNALRGRLLTLREGRYMDLAALDTMTSAVQEAHARLGLATGAFLNTPEALAPLTARLDTLAAQIDAADTSRALTEALDALAGLSAELDLLSELLGALPVEDATARTRVVEAIAALYGRLNGVRARAEQARKALGAGERTAQFAAQLGLYAQAVASALGRATTPEKAEEGLARALVALEELEGQFGDDETFLPDILAKRDEVREAFEARRQTLQDERQRKAQSVMDAASRILSGLGARAARLKTLDELNAFFASDPLIVKVRDLGARLRELKDTVKADDLDARLKAARDQAARSLRDRTELFEGDGTVIRLGRHRFNVNTQPLDLTLLPRGDDLAVHLTGTEYLDPLDHPALNDLRAYWSATLVSESAELSRAEYLAGEVLRAAQDGQEGLTLAHLHALSPDDLTRTVAAFAAPRYREGYEKGIHDHDAARLLQALLPLLQAAGTLVYPPAARALGTAYWAEHPARRAHWQVAFGNAHAMHALFGRREALDTALGTLADEVAAFLTGAGLPHTSLDARQAATFLGDELKAPAPTLGFSQAAADLNAALDTQLQTAGLQDTLDHSLAQLEGDLAGRWALLHHWLGALCAAPPWAPMARAVPEAVALRLFGAAVPHTVRDVPLGTQVTGLLSGHPRIQGGTLPLAPDDLLTRLERHRSDFLPGFQRYQAARQEATAQERARLRLDELRPRPLTSFVRNRLIQEVYLPIIGDNLAKQMGTAGEGKRSDLMGLLMLISPPGYGKTTLMEYVAHRLGLVFVRVNGPALGHEVRSLDPAQAPDAGSRQELEKLNLALEMGGNVMLYVDDIQHTHPEFLQKFISLTDGTRRIEGVWRGQPRTYDLRGRKFAVVMAGNPYTESGEVFKIPDMLANRADIYNLGDVLGGMEDAFQLSYIENSLTSNPVLAPLATRDLNDLYLLVNRAQGREVSTNSLSHPYSAAEVEEIVGTLQKLLAVRDDLARINAQYIASAAQDDRYRTEPPFKLQGSYRNMNKLAEKISAVMTDAEVDQVVTDHYQGEAQLLTTGAEENLLKLAELRGTLTPEQAARWEAIKADYRRNKAMGDDADTGARMVAQLADIAQGLQGLGTRQTPMPAPTVPPPPAEPLADALREGLAPLLRELTRSLQERPASTAPVPTAPDDTALRTALAPLLAGLATTTQKQDQTNAAIYELVEVIRKRQNVVRGPAGPVGTSGRHSAGQD